MNQAPLPSLLARARAGDPQALGELLERHRDQLRMLASRQLDSRLAVRVDASDVVQLTFLEAQRDFAQFQGAADEELLAWLRVILSHNVGEVVQQHVQAQRRSTQREQPLAATSGSGAVRPLASDESTPSQHAMRGEAADRLLKAIDALAEPQREAIRLRYWEGLSLKQLAERLNRSEMAVAGLLKRGLRGLRENLQ